MGQKEVWAERPEAGWDTPLQSGTQQLQVPAPGLHKNRPSAGNEEGLGPPPLLNCFLQTNAGNKRSLPLTVCLLVTPSGSNGEAQSSDHTGSPG